METKEQEFLTALYKANYETLFRYVTCVSRAKGIPNAYIPDLAEDIVQDTFHTATKKVSDAVTYENPGGWLMNICKHKFQEHMRRIDNDRRRLLLLEMADTLPASPTEMDAPLAEVDLAITMDKIRKSLSPEEYHLFDLLILRRAGHSTAARELDITVWTSQKRWERLREKLKKLLS